jgi:hypothetical protein
VTTWASKGLKIRVAGMWSKRWVRVSAMVLCAFAVISFGVLSYCYVTVSRLIDQSLHGERDKVFPQVFARPLEIYRGQSLTIQQLVDRLNDLGYSQRPRPEKPGEFSMIGGTVTIIPRPSQFKGEVVEVSFAPAAPPPSPRRKAPPLIRLSDHVLRL